MLPTRVSLPYNIVRALLSQISRLLYFNNRLIGRIHNCTTFIININKNLYLWFFYNLLFANLLSLSIVLTVTYELYKLYDILQFIFVK